MRPPRVRVSHAEFTWPTGFNRPLNGHGQVETTADGRVFYTRSMDRKPAKGTLMVTTVHSTPTSADAHAVMMRKCGYAAKRFERVIRADQVELLVWLVITRKRREVTP